MNVQNSLWDVFHFGHRAAIQFYIFSLFIVINTYLYIQIQDNKGEGEEKFLFRKSLTISFFFLPLSLLQVPDRFLEVAQVTLREFFNAIVAGKDADPSWKKAIYKVICKLDSEVPEVFKSPSCLQELLHD